MPFLIFMAIVNLDYLQASNINYFFSGHDEYIAVKEIYNLVNPNSSKHLMMSILAGDIYYYGRIVFCIDAMASYIPFKIWGISGMVYATRMAHTLYLLLGLLILSRTFLLAYYKKIFFYIGCFSIIWAFYFMAVPKPEPLQILFISLFFYYRIKRKNITLSYFFIGLSVAAKINFLFLLPIALLFEIYIKFKTQQKIIKPIMHATMFSIIGFLIGNPGLIVSPLKPQFLKAYLANTIYFPRMTYDDLNIGIIDWTRQFALEYFQNWFIFCLFCISLILVIYKIYKSKIESTYNFSALLIVFGLVLIILVFLKIDRLWTHYTYTGFILIWLGILHFANKNIIYFNSIISGFLLFYFLLNITQQPWSSNHSEVLETKLNGIKTYQYLQKKQFKNACIEISVYYPFSEFVNTNYYHPFTSEFNRPKNLMNWYDKYDENTWKNNFDYVVMNKYKNKFTGIIPISENTTEIKFIDGSNTGYTRDTSFGKYLIFTKNAN